MIVITYEFTEITKRHPAKGTLTHPKKWLRTTPRNIFNSIFFIGHTLKAVPGLCKNIRIIVDGVPLTDDQIANCPVVGYFANIGWDKPAATYCYNLLVWIEDCKRAKAEADKTALALEHSYKVLTAPLAFGL